MLKKLRGMTKWGMGTIIVVFVLAIFADWGARMSGWQAPQYALSIDGKEITFDQLERLVSYREDRIRESSGLISDTDRLYIYKNVVDDLIMRALVEEASGELGTKPTSREIVHNVGRRYFSTESGDIDYNRWRQARRFQPARIWTALEHEVESDLSFFKTYRFLTSGLTVSEGMERDYFNLAYQRAEIRHILIRPGSFVEEDAVRAYYRDHPDSFTLPDRMRLSAIRFAIPGNDEAARLDARSAAQVALLRIQSGRSWNRVFNEISEDTDPITFATEVGWIARGQTPELDTVVFSMRPGRISDVIEGPDGFLILKAEEFSRSHLQPLSEAGERIRAILADDTAVRRARALAGDLLGRIEEGEDFAALAQEYSSGRSGADGGYLGEIMPGEIDPSLYPDTADLELVAEETGRFDRSGDRPRLLLDASFSNAAFELEEGEVSDVVPSSHGYHIIRLDRRRPGDPAILEDRRSAIRSELLDRLRTQVFLDWVDARKEDADIEMNPIVRDQYDRASAL